MHSFDRYLVTGATGFLGKVLIRKLASAGASVRALVLENDPASDALPSGVERIAGDVADPTSLNTFFSGDLSHACVIHCAGLISIATRKDPRLWHVNADGTKHVMAHCLRTRPERVVCVSSVHAIPERPKGQIICEVDSFSPPLVRGQYAKSKAAGAQYALDAAREGLSVSVVHPSGIIGPFDDKRGSITSTILSFCNRRLPLAVHGGYDFVDVRDVADGILACAERGRAGEGYILSGRYVTLKEIFAILKRAGYGAEPHYLPLWFVRLNAIWMELDSLVHRKPLFLTPYSAYTLGSNACFSYEKAARELGYCPRPLEETLFDMVRWLKREGALPAPVGA